LEPIRDRFLTDSVIIGNQHLRFTDS